MGRSRRNGKNEDSYEDEAAPGRFSDDEEDYDDDDFEDDDEEE